MGVFTLGSIVLALVQYTVLGTVCMYSEASSYSGGVLGFRVLGFWRFRVSRVKGFRDLWGSGV